MRRSQGSVYHDSIGNNCSVHFQGCYHPIPGGEARKPCSPDLIENFCKAETDQSSAEQIGQGQTICNEKSLVL
ncbi:hypothetical protein KCV00_g272, partial [Aureobasidium melanogenum]